MHNHAHFGELSLDLPGSLEPMASRDLAGYYFMIKDGKVSGGAGVPEECLELPGFHVKIEWAPQLHRQTPQAVAGGQGPATDGVGGARPHRDDG